MAKPQASKPGSAQKKAPATAQRNSDTKGAWTTIDTTGKSPEEIAALAEQAIAEKKRKPRNKVSPGPSKGSKNTGKDKPNVKSESKSQVEDEKRPVGRPSGFTQEIADLICEALAEGHSLRKICEADNMPNKGTVFRWLAQNKQFSDQYARAREEQAECLFDDMLAIADDGRNDTYEDGEGRVRTDHDVIARSKLRVETRKWMAGKLKPKKYGDKVDVNHGVQPDNPLASLLTQINGTALPVVKSTTDD